MRLDEAKKILNDNGYELINEDFNSFMAAGGPLASITCFFLVVLYAGGLSGIFYGIGKGIKKIYSILVKRFTRRTEKDKILLYSFIETLESLKKEENQEKLAKIIFDKMDFIKYCNNKYIKTLDQFLLYDKINISNEEKEHYKNDYNDDDIDIQCNIRREMIIKFLKGMLPKNLKLDKGSISTLTSVIVSLGYRYYGFPNHKENEFSLDFNSLIDIIVNNINKYDYNK